MDKVSIAVQVFVRRHTEITYVTVFFKCCEKRHRLVYRKTERPQLPTENWLNELNGNSLPLHCE